jgi:hypothetical protein
LTPIGSYGASFRVSGRAPAASMTGGLSVNGLAPARWIPIGIYSLSHPASMLRRQSSASVGCGKRSVDVNDLAGGAVSVSDDLAAGEIVAGGDFGVCQRECCVEVSAGCRCELRDLVAPNSEREVNGCVKPAIEHTKCGRWIGEC